jgi:hypothetical protein
MLQQGIASPSYQRNVLNKIKHGNDRDVGRDDDTNPLVGASEMVVGRILFLCRAAFCDVQWGLIRQTNKLETEVSRFLARNNSVSLNHPVQAIVAEAAGRIDTGPLAWTTADHSDRLRSSQGQEEGLGGVGKHGEARLLLGKVAQCAGVVKLLSGVLVIVLGLCGHDDREAAFRRATRDASLPRAMGTVSQSTKLVRPPTTSTLVSGDTM